MEKSVLQLLAMTPEHWRLWRVLTCAFVVFFHQALLAETGFQVVLATQLQAGPILLHNSLSVLRDASQQLTLQAVQDPALAGRFARMPQSRQALHFGLTQDAIWLRLELKNDGPETLNTMLELANANLARVDFYAPQQAALKTGYSLPFASRPFKNRFFVFPLQLAAHTEQTLFLRLQTNEPLALPVRLWSLQDYREHERNDYALQSGFYGLAIALALFNLLLFCILLDLNYLLFVLFSAGVALTVAANQGIGAEFLWPDSPPWAQYATLVCASLSTATLIQLMRRMLGTAIRMKRVDQVLHWLALFHLVLPLVYAYGHTIVPGLLIHVFSASLILAAGLRCSIKRQHHAHFFVAAFVTTYITVAMMILGSFNLLNLDFADNQCILPGMAIQLLLLAFALIDRVNVMRQEKVAAQQLSYSAQERLVENLKNSERVLEQHVRQRTTALTDNNFALLATHGKLNKAWQHTKHLHQQAETANADAAMRLEALRNAQVQLVQMEKMAALGQLIASVAHEINTPIGAVKSSGRLIRDNLSATLDNLVQLLQELDPPSLELFLRLCNQAWQPGKLQSAREERLLAREIAERLEQLGVRQVREKASILAQLNAKAAIADYLPLLQHEQAELILAAASCMVTIISSTNNINIAIDRVDKIVFTLNSFTREGTPETASLAALREGMEAILHIYQSNFKQGIELQREYDDVPSLLCHVEQLNQVWSNLIHNALQAMGKRGVLYIRIGRQNDGLLVSISDTGCGMAAAQQAKIFEPFFTTKAAGEGCGLGLSIVKKIIDQHQGRIQVHSKSGVGTTFEVWLPLLPEAK
jgi:signal transduction histidine kinase